MGKRADGNSNSLSKILASFGKYDHTEVGRPLLAEQLCKCHKRGALHIILAFVKTRLLDALEHLISCKGIVRPS